MVETSREANLQSPISNHLRSPGTSSYHDPCLHMDFVLLHNARISTARLHEEVND